MHLTVVALLTYSLLVPPAVVSLSFQYTATVHTSLVCGSSQNSGVVVSISSAPSSSSAPRVSSSSATSAYTGGAYAVNGACGGAGYNLTSVAAYGDLSVASGGYNYYVRVCGNTSSTGSCSGQFCQGSTVLSYYDTTQSLWYVDPTGVNVTQKTQDGAQCTINGFTYNRESEIVFQCNSAATTPVLVTVNEVHSCYYQAVIQTSAVCSTSPSAVGTTGPLGGVGSTWYDSRCGGGKYNLNSLSTSDLLLVNGGTYWYLRPCGAVSNSNCSSTAGAMYSNETAQLCQYQSGSAYTASYYAPASQLWTITSTGISLYVQDGASCNNYAREMTIQFVCSAAATTPVITTVIESPQCYYTVQVQTSAVCSAARGSSSSTGGGGAPYATSVSSLVSSSSSRTAASSSSAVVYPSSSTAIATSTPRSPSTTSSASSANTAVSSSTSSPSLPGSSSSSSSSSTAGALAGGGGSSGLSGGAIAGIVIGSVVGLAILCALAVLIFSRRGGGKKSSSYMGDKEVAARRAAAATRRRAVRLTTDRWRWGDMNGEESTDGDYTE